MKTYKLALPGILFLLTSYYAYSQNSQKNISTYALKKIELDSAIEKSLKTGDYYTIDNTGNFTKAEEIVHKETDAEDKNVKDIFIPVKLKCKSGELRLWKPVISPVIINIKLIPNPAIDHITISGYRVEPDVYGTVTVLNNIGQVVLRRQVSLSEADIRLDLANLNTGMYAVVLANGKTTYNEKLIIAK